MPIDTLERLLTTLAVRANAFALCEIKSGWRLAFDPVESVTIHYVLAGSGALLGTSDGGVAYQTRSIIVVPGLVAHSLGEPGPAHRISSSAAACGLLANGLVRFTAGDGSRDTLVVCATMTATYGGALGVFDGLSIPLVQHARADDALDRVFDAVMNEVTSPSLGTQSLVEALLKQALILVLRHQMSDLKPESPLLAVFHDARLARTVAAVIEQPGSGWTTDTLASVAGMSRSGFCDRFAKAFVYSPMEFVQIVRLRLAADLLRATDLSIPVIAASAGFSSQTYFTRVFKSGFGVTPLAYRTRAREGEAIAYALDTAAALGRASAADARAAAPTQLNSLDARAATGRLPRA